MTKRGEETSEGSQQRRCWEPSMDRCTNATRGGDALQAWEAALDAMERLNTVLRFNKQANATS